MTEWIKHNPDKEEKKESKWITKKEKKKEYITKKKKEEPKKESTWITKKDKYDAKRPQGGWKD